MKILRFDSVGGGSGDMILGALIELCERAGIPMDAIEKPLHDLIPDHFHLIRAEKSSHGMSGKMLTVDIHEHEHGTEHTHEHEHEHEHEHHHHHHRSFSDIRSIIQSSGLPDDAKFLSIQVFETLAVAEGEVHGVPAEDVHFHEVGATDSIIDIVGSCLAYTLLNPDGIELSPLPVGTGTVRCAHGVYPLPAPATAALLERFQLAISTDNEPCEMLTPTAAALFAVWPKAALPVSTRVVTSFNSFGHREMESRPNVLRVSVCESNENPAYSTERLTRLDCNLDDATGEILASTMSALFAAGALDVWFVPVTMKKSRPGIQLSVLCAPGLAGNLTETLFRHAGTFGVREETVLRHSLNRRWEAVSTKYGEIRVKVGGMGDSDVCHAPEFEDCQRAATEHGVPVATVIQCAMRAYPDL